MGTDFVDTDNYYLCFDMDNVYIFVFDYIEGWKVANYQFSFWTKKV